MIEVTRLSNGSGASGGRNPWSFAVEVDDGRVGRPAVERVEVERQTEEPGHLRLDRRVERLDEDAARRRLDPHLPPADHAVEPALVPEVRDVRAERAEPLGRDLEVVRLRDRKERHRVIMAA